MASKIMACLDTFFSPRVAKTVSFKEVIDHCFKMDLSGFKFTEVNKRMWDEKYEYVIYLQREKELIAIRIYADRKLTVSDTVNAVKFFNINLVKRIGIKKLEISETGYLFKIKPQTSDDVDQPDFVQKETCYLKNSPSHNEYLHFIKFTRCDIIGVKAIELNEEPLEFGNISVALNTEAVTKDEAETVVNAVTEDHAEAVTNDEAETVVNAVTNAVTTDNVDVVTEAVTKREVHVNVEIPIEVAAPVVSSTQWVKPNVLSPKNLRDIEEIKQGILNNSHRPLICSALQKRLNNILSGESSKSKKSRK